MELRGQDEVLLCNNKTYRDPRLHVPSILLRNVNNESVTTPKPLCL